MQKQIFLRKCYNLHFRHFWDFWTSPALSGIVLDDFLALPRKSKYSAPLGPRGARRALASRFAFACRAMLVDAIGTHGAIFANIGAETQSPFVRGSIRYAKRQGIDL